MSTHKKKLLILVDGSSYLHRAYHALPALTTSKGEPTGAIYGVINMLKKTLVDYKPDYIAVVFDAKGKNFRHELYEEYKANRPPMEDDLKVQIKPLHELIVAMGLPILVVEGVEADDVIGTLASRAKKDGMAILISTGDKDMAQLVDEDITLVNTMNSSVMDEKGVVDKFGVNPNQIIDYLTLVGDTSDNVPGVEGAGPKTAAKWLQEYKTLSGVIAHKDAIKGKVGDKLRASLDKLQLTKELVTIKQDLNLELSLSDLTAKAADKDKLIELLMRFEFRSWLADVVEDKKPESDDARKCHTILTQEDFAYWLDKLNKAPIFAFDTETTSLDIMQAKLVGISFAVAIGEAIYIPFSHAYIGAPKQLDRDYVLEKLKPIFANSKQLKLGQNIKYDMNVLANYAVEVKGIGYDTMLESYVINSTSNQHDKESLALRYLGKSITNYEDLVGKGAKQISFEQVDLEAATPYAAFDADLVLRLHQEMWSQIEKNPGQEKIFKEIEMPLVSVLSRMERRGVSIDEEFLNRYSRELEAKLHELEVEIYKESGKVFNISSPAQLQEILYDDLKLPVLQKTPTGQPSTAEAVLQELALEYSLPKLVLEFRSLSKLKSTYADALPKQIDPKTRRVHTSYNQAVTATGRLSSTNPNLQNIPIRSEAGRKIRKAFIAPPGFKIVSADYSQIELRVMAHLSQDENLLKAFNMGIDVHRMVASEVFGVDMKDVSDNQRRDAKTINFGLIYGMSAFGLAKNIGMSNKEAKHYIDLYFARYPKVHEYMESMRKLAREQGFVESIFGRRLYIQDAKSKNFARRAAAERVAINAPIQGSAADVIKLAMINIDSWIQKCSFKIAMVMQVHDELVFEVEDSHIDTAIEEIKTRMEGAVKFTVPILVNVGVGANWDDAH